MADVTQNRNQQTAGGQRNSLVGNRFAEHAAQAKHAERNDIVKQNDAEQRPEAGAVTQIVHAEQHLK